MQTRASFGWKHAVALLAIAAVASVAFASVFVFYGGTITAYYQAPPVVWASGTNTNGTDIGGKTISVNITGNSTTLSIAVHPTYGYTYYEDIATIKNNDTANGYYIAIRVTNPANITSIAGASVKLIISNTTSTEVIDLGTTGTSPWYYLPAGTSANVSIQFYLPGGVKLPNAIITGIQLIYSTSNAETPPSTV